jgi:glutamate dehydrogenase (NADP+)
LKAKVLLHQEKQQMLEVAASGLEMTQNSIRLNWTSEEVDGRLKEIMVGIHNQCKKYGTDSEGYVNYKGANVWICKSC